MSGIYGAAGGLTRVLGTDGRAGTRTARPALQFHPLKQPLESQEARMFRPAFVASTLAAATAALALGACSPQDLASAGDSSQAVGMVAMAN